MKKKIIISITFILLLGLVGCSRNFTFRLLAFETNTSTKMSMTHYRLHGVKEKKLTVKEGEPLEIKVDIETKDGTLNAYIYNKDMEYSYEGKDIPTSSFTVTLTEPGEYTLKLEADKHSGSYSFTW